MNMADVVRLQMDVFYRNEKAVAEALLCCDDEGRVVIMAGARERGINVSVLVREARKRMDSITALVNGPAATVSCRTFRIPLSTKEKP